MAVFKCKMCGGNLEIAEGAVVAECEYCGTKQTVPVMDNEKKIALFSRANRLRFACEFDKAAGIYESIVAEFSEEAEAYWGLVLCKYGIEYVDDPATGKKIPTCHRSSFDSVMDNTNFEQACENADPLARSLYREEAKQIEELRKGIIEVSGKEEPYDIFICYKETDENGDRTLDSVLAQDVYDALTEKGYRVFFSRITLEDKLGQEYEPYIFAALNSAKVMLAFGTDYEYFNAVWVKNEWSRYLQLMTQDKAKHLIPCYKGIDAYDMPKEFAKLQAQDMGKVGAVQDLLRGIGKLLPKGDNQAAPIIQQVVQTVGGQNTQSLLKRAKMFLEDSEWDSANEYCEKILDTDPECAEAYLIKVCATKKKAGFLQLGQAEQAEYFSLPAYQKAVKFADEELAQLISEINAASDQTLATRIEKERIEKEQAEKARRAKIESEKRVIQGCLDQGIINKHEEETAALNAELKEIRATCTAYDKQADDTMSLKEVAQRYYELHKAHNYHESGLQTSSAQIRQDIASLVKLRDEAIMQRNNLSFIKVSQRSELARNAELYDMYAQKLRGKLPLVEEYEKVVAALSAHEARELPMLSQKHTKFDAIKALKSLSALNALSEANAEWEKVIPKSMLGQQFDGQPGEIIKLGENFMGTDSPLEWVVLENQNGLLLLLSKYIIDARVFSEHETFSYTFSSIRGFLSNKSTFFRDSESSLLTQKSIKGLGEKDPIFLLSKDEVEHLLATNPVFEKYLKATALQYLYKQKRIAYNDKYYCPWWLESMKKREYSFQDIEAYRVDYDGKIGTSSAQTSKGVGVRPCIIIDLS